MKSTKRAVFSGLAITSAVALLAGCASGPTEDPFLACAVSDEGSFSDKSFNEAAYDGLKKAETELGIEIKGFESKGTQDFTPNLEQAVADGCDVIFAVGFNFSDGSLKAVVEANTTSKFVWIDGWNEGWSNLKPISYSMNQSSFLAGYLSAAYSTTKVLATYGGLDIPAVTDFMVGWENGAKYWAKETGTAVTILPRDFTDPAINFGDFAGARAITDQFLAQGADVIFPVAGGLFSSTYESIKASGKDAVFLGVDKDIALTSAQYADLTLTSVEKRMTQAAFDVIKDLVDGKAFEVTDYVGTLANDGTGLSEFYAFDSKVDAALKTKLAELSAAIQAGTLDPLATP